MLIRRYLIATLLPTLTVLIPMAGAQEPDESTNFDPKALEIVMRAGGNLTAMKSMRFEMVTSLQIQFGPADRPQKSTKQVSVVRPNKIAIVHKDGLPGETTVSDGRRLVTYRPRLNRYVEEEAPESLDDLVKRFPSGPMEIGQILVYPLLGSSAAESLIEGMGKLEYLGEEKHQGTDCDRIRMTRKPPGVSRSSFEFWIEVKAPFLIRKMATDMGMKVVIELNNWEADAVIGDEVFQFQPPEGAEKIDSFGPNRLLP